MAGLRRVIHEVRELTLGDETSYSDGRLTVSRTEAEQVVADRALSQVRVSVTSPGDSVRIVKPLDVVEPRSKGSGGAGAFPGWLAPVDRPRDEEVHVLRGAAVLAAGFLPRLEEGLIDMSGPAAELSPFGSTHNVVVEFDKAEDASWEAVDEALRRGLLRLAVHLGDAALEAEPDTVEEPVAPGPVDDLPRVGAITNLQTQGSFKDVFVYGRSLSACLPTLIDPDELDDGIVVSGQYGHPALRNPTYMHLNNPVVAALRRRHGDDLAFGGLVLSPEPTDEGAKEHISTRAAELCRAAGFDAVVVTKEGGGNADNDISLKLDALDEFGIPSVGIYAEFTGPEGTGTPLVAPPRSNVPMVSVGNYDERVSLPAVERAIGGERFDNADAGATDEFEVPVAVILCALNPLGWGHLTSREAA
ncbi:MAG TPA: glycine/sarcosine/betaine reductase component B subunit [Nitriliruptorales bacterium]|nr:glycine/sarcosine/betaine reductase component B subunit [Nitriliruptorales bacterium]